MRRLVVLLAFFAMGATATACRPGTVPGTPESVYTHNDSVIAVNQFFPEWWLNGTAHCIARKESNWWPYSRNGRYEGFMQLDSTNPGYRSSMVQAAAVQGRVASFFDPFVSAQVARIIFDVRVSKGLDGWAPWSTAGACR